MYTTTKKPNDAPSIWDIYHDHPVKPRKSKQKIKRKPRSKARGRSVYPTYAWRGYDPILDVVQSVMEDCGETMEDISIGSGVSMSTLNNYKFKYTAHPRGSCVAAVLRYCHAKYGVWYKKKFIEASPL